MPAVSRVLSPLGGVLVAFGVFIPYAEVDGNGVSVFDPDALEWTWAFALEPLAVALASFAPLVFRHASPRLLAVMLAAIGAQTALMYLGYVVLSTSEGYDPAFGAEVGLAGALLVLSAGAIGLRGPAESLASGVTSDSALLPPSGWYPDPTGESNERFWTGEEWAPETR